MAVIFKNPDVAAKYEACRETDGKVHIPCGKEKGTGFTGPLSLITLPAADKAFKYGSNILKLKEAAAKKQEAKKEEKKDDSLKT